MASTGNPGKKRGEQGHHFALVMALIFILMLVMIFLMRNKNSASPNVTPPASHRRVP